MRRIRGARAAHAVIRASGRVPTEEATRERMLRRIARQENEQLSGDLDPSASVVLDGID